MGISLQPLYNQVHQFASGLIDIDQAFSGNVLAVDVTTKPEYIANSQIIGYLYQVFQTASKGYAIRSGKDLIRLELPETQKLVFIPTPYLSSSYTLKIDYTTVGAVVDGQNTATIPTQILELPSNLQAIALDLAQLQSAIANLEQPNISWEAIANKPLTFPPASHNHSLSEIDGLVYNLSTINLGLFSLSGRVDDLENIPQSGGNSAAIPLSVDTVLESNKTYIATVNNLVCPLPSSANIGDKISLINGNFSSFRVSHGSSSQLILNSSTSTIQGSNSGIILKPYSSISLVFMASNLWVSFNRNRTINNFSPITSESAATQKSYTATSSNINANFGTTLANISNGVKQPTGALGDGLLHESQTLDVLLTVPESILLDSFDLFVGQGNTGLNSAPDYRVTSVTVYRGNSISGVNLGTFTFTANNGIQQSRNVSSSETSSQYLFVFTGFSNRMGILELEIFGRGATGGEVSVI